jgi:PAS domain S-box-containing protein
MSPVVLAFALQWMPSGAPQVWSTFCVAVFFSSWIGGLRAGLFATVISTILVWYFFLPPEVAWTVAHFGDISSSVVFMSMGVAFSLFHDHLRKANQRASDALKAVKAANERHESSIRESTGELAQSHESVRTSERRFRELVEALPAAIYMTDADGRITFFNHAALTLWGCAPELGSSRWSGSWRLYWPDGAPLPHDECPMAVALKENRPVRGREAVAERPDGSRVPFIAFPTPLRDASGAIVGGVNMLVDITERKQGEQALRESEERFRQVVENIEEVFWVTDLEKNKIFFVSLGYEKLWGETRESLYHRHGGDRGHRPEDRERVLRHALLKQTRGEYDEEYRIIRRDGTLRWIHDRAFPIRNADGTMDRIAGIAEDITERKQAEEALRLRSCQQAALAGLGQRALEGGEFGQLLDNAAALVARTSTSTLLDTELQPGGEASCYVQAWMERWTDRARDRASDR